MTLHVSQIFYSFQGEGARTGNLAVWLRLFGCNLRCPGFSQQNPTDKSTYIPININPVDIKTLDDFPVIEYGCDTLYAIDPRFKHLRRDMKVEDAIKEVISYLPDGKFIHPKTGNDIDLCITGGEPLLQQNELGNLFTLLNKEPFGYTPQTVQIETNGTTDISRTFGSILDACSFRTMFNISPKLFNVSGEKYAWNYKAIASYGYRSNYTTLKVVINNRDESWNELEMHLQKLVDVLDHPDYMPPIFIMPVGSTRDQQTNIKEIEEITKRAINEGYHISGRLHCLNLGNAIDV